MKLLMFLFTIFGTVEIIIAGEPTKPIRNLFSKSKLGGAFIHCPLCLGFWVGIFWGYWIMKDMLSPWYIAVFANGCMGSGIAYLLHSLLPPSLVD